jgi:tetratricopeptide (TPR) repeat protein
MRASFFESFLAGQEVRMRHGIKLLVISLFFAASTFAQIGKSVSVAAGTPEDKALADIYAAPDTPDKIALLDKFMQEYGKGDLELLGDQLYVQTYLAQKNYAKVYQYGEKALALDPESLSTVVNMVHAAEEQGNTDRLFSVGEKAAAIVARYKASPSPTGTSAEDWSRQKDLTLNNAQQDIGYVQYAMVNAAYKTTNAAARAALFERYLAAFLDSPYTATIREQTAVTYQEAQNTPKMLKTAQDILAADPNNVAMLLLLADYWSDKGEQLDIASADAQKALDLLAQAKKPENLSDEQWQQQLSLQKGIAYSAIGEVRRRKDQDAQAVDAFKQASPLLKSNTVTYARNLCRLGLTLSNMKRIPEARVALTEAASLNSPYKSTAQEALDKIGGAPPKKAARKSS